MAETTGSDPRKWYPDDGGWELHIASTISEWIVVLSFCFYLLSFVPEFRYIIIEEPKVFLTNEGRASAREEVAPIVQSTEEVDVIVRQEGSNIVT